MRPSISPLEIRRRSFAKRLRGYDVNEVGQFLDTLADDLEELFRDHDEMERENVRLKDENARYRANETTLKETLFLAQRSADGLKASTEKEADRVLRDAERQAERLVQQGLEKVSDYEKRVRELRMERKNFHLKLQAMLDMFQEVLKFDREEDDLDSSVSIIRAKRREGETA